MSTTYLKSAREIESAAVALVDIVGTIPLADAVRVLMSRCRCARGAASDGLRLAVNSQKIRTLRLQAGEWAVGRKVAR